MLRSSLRWMKQIIAACLMLVVLLCVCEIGLRVYDSHTGQVTRCELYDLGVLAKSRFCHHEIKPLLHLNMSARGEDEEFVLETNSLGLRGPELELPKGRETYRILCLGDERTAGLDVPEEDTFCYQLQKFLQRYSNMKIEVINAGTPDYCPLLSTLQLRLKLSGTEPNLVVMNWDMSDVWDDYRYRRYTTMGKNNTPLGCSNPLLDPPRTRERKRVMDLFLIPEFCVQHGVELWARRVLPAPPKEIDSPTGKYTWLQDQPPDWSVYIQQSLDIMVPARDHAEKLGATFLVAVHPAPWQVAATASNGESVRASVGVGQGVVYRSRKPFQLIEGFCQQASMFCCDLSEEIQSDSLAVDFYQHDSANYSPEGHRVAAQNMARYIMTQISGPWELPSASPRSTTPVRLSSGVRERRDR